ncbi:MAG: DNA primase large subunit PriL [Methanomassiliicoccales archaeon]|nr:DNA primase large subunit PriL [Methanomassiliicoccales archaeon]
MDPRRLARFPFLKEAIAYVKENDVDLNDLLQEFIFSEARSRGKRRVMDAIIEGEVGTYPISTDEECLLEILSYPVARMIVSCVNDSYLIKRYALAEAVTMNKRLVLESAESVASIADELGVKVAIIDESLRMHFSDYLRYTSKMRSTDWKLVNTEVENGYVYLNKHRFARVLQQALQEKIENELPLEVSNEILQRFSKDLAEIRTALETRIAKYKAEDLGRISIIKLPPCMRKLVGMIQAGENIPHSGRFAITAFLHGIGLSQEEILKLFSSSPDFDQSKTRYQIEHITGEISGTKYTAPECSTMKSYGLCYEPDSLCRKITHPFNYYRTRSRKRKEISSESNQSKVAGDKK